MTYNGIKDGKKIKIFNIHHNLNKPAGNYLADGIYDGTNTIVENIELSTIELMQCKLKGQDINN